MAGWRHERVAEMIHKEIAERLRTQIKDPEMEPISITGVEVTRDLGRARIMYLSLGGGSVGERGRAALTRAASAMRGPIGRALRLRTAPEIHFVEDTHHQAVQHVHALLSEVGRDLRGESQQVGEE